MLRQSTSEIARTVPTTSAVDASKRACVLGVVMLVGCTPMTLEAVVREEERAYQQAEREAEFFRDKQQCDELGGITFIERMGRARRRDVIRRVPGYRDRWYCRL